MTVLIEVQTSSKKSETAKEDFKTEGWAKFALFDQKNRLLSGRWRIPLKALPVSQNESLATISRLPTVKKVFLFVRRQRENFFGFQFDAVELHYRLVNGQDAEDQSNVTVAPTMRDLYNLPAHVRFFTFDSTKIFLFFFVLF